MMHGLSRARGVTKAGRMSRGRNRLLHDGRARQLGVCRSIGGDPNSSDGSDHDWRLAALRIVWSAGRGEAAVALALQLVGGLGTAAVVLLGRRVLDGLLAANRTGGGIADLLTSTVTLATVTAALDLLGRCGVRKRSCSPS
jgi:hypothetical protein